MVQKTLRFYDTSPKDIKALQKLNNYRLYGFNNSREMVIDALYKFSKDEDSTSVSNIDTDELVDKIVEKLSSYTGKVQKEVVSEQIDNEDSFMKALDFINSL